MTSAVTTGPDAVDTSAVVERLRKTFATGRTRELRWRHEQLDGVVRLVTEQEERFAEALATDIGRSALDTWMYDLSPTANEATFARKRVRRWMRTRRTMVPAAAQPGLARYQYEPLGVALIISPWNYPAYLALAPLVGALAAGNCAVVKPSEQSPATSALLAELLPRYVDADAVAVVQGAQAETQNLLAQGFDHAFFTGSPEVGALVMAAAAPTLTPVTLELGGKCPVIVAGDANIEVAGRRIAWAKLVNSGQTCIAPDYVLVDSAVRDELVDSLVAATEAMNQAPLRLVNSRHAQRLASLLEHHGGTVAHGGQVDVDGLTAEPTIVVDPDTGSRLLQEEIFGPILPIVSVDGVDTAIDFVNQRPKPLALYVFSGSRDTGRQVTSQTSSGSAGVNQLLYQVLAPQLPFGGVGRSGSGSYHGRWGFETFSHRKAVLAKPTRPDPSILYPPYTAAAQKLLRRLL